MSTQLNDYLKVTIGFLTLRDNVTVCIVTNTIENSKIVKKNFTKLYNEIPEWFKPSLKHNTIKETLLNNGSSFYILTNTRELQGRTFQSLAYLRTKDHYNPPYGIYNYGHVNVMAVDL